MQLKPHGIFGGPIISREGRYFLCNRIGVHRRSLMAGSRLESSRTRVTYASSLNSSLDSSLSDRFARGLEIRLEISSACLKDEPRAGGGTEREGRMFISIVMHKHLY